MRTEAELLSQPPAQVHQTGAELLAQAVCDHEDAIAQRERARCNDQFQDEGPEVPLAEFEAKVDGAQFEIVQAALGLKPIEVLWRGLSDAERVAFVAENESDIWRALECVADHQKR